MKRLFLISLFCAALLAAFGNDGDYEDVEHLDPSEDTSEDGTTKMPLIGRPDGHDGWIRESPEPQHAETESPLLGRPDGHEPGHLLGRPDGHEPGHLLGRPDGHEAGGKDLIGKPDGHDAWDKETMEDEYTYDDESEYTDEEEPLVRCKRPLCMMYCDFGFQTDASGCPVCKCLDDPCQGVDCTDGNICHPVECDDQRSCVKLSAKCIPPSRNCPEPMCANFCPNGYEHNVEGCMTCNCVSNVSQPQDVHDDNYPCPMVMCATFCPGGYEKNERGCQTCTCIAKEENSCGETVCDVGQICRTVDSKSFCAPKPVCELAQEMAFMKRDGPRVQPDATRMHVPECNEDGSYKPVQCFIQDCWCVDDRGKEIDGTRRLITPGDHTGLNCKPNMTTAVHIHMLLISTIDEEGYDDENSETENEEDDDDDDDEDDDFILNLEKSHETLQTAASTWLLVDKEFISITEVVQKSKTSISIQLHILSDGSVDLPSAVEHMKRRMRMGYCSIPLKNSAYDEEVYFAPDVESLNVEHQFSGDADVISCGYGYDFFHGHFHLQLAVTTMLLLLIVLSLFSVVMIRRHRRTHRSLQFRHHKLENQLSVEQTKHVKGEVALDAQNESTVILVSADELEKKLAIA